VKDDMTMSGHLSLDIYKDGVLIEQFRGQNLVLAVGRTNSAKLLGGDANGRVINRVGLGTNSAGPFDSDTVLTGQVLLPFTSVTYPTPGVVQFDFNVGTGDCNGMDIREFGLVTTSGSLVARKTRGPLAKDSSLSFTGRWVLTF
jgi:hypothetical protein